MRSIAFALPLVLILGASTAAHALSQKKHRSLSRDACAAAGLPWDFCERVGVEAYNVDSYEWNDLAAHAQPEAGQTLCQGANSALARLRWLGADINSSLRGLARSSDPDVAEHIAIQLGRALHTVQDDCAHKGIPNPQHAWASLSDACSATSLSPDIQPSAITCAQTETAAVIAAFAVAVHAAGVSYDRFDDVDEDRTHWPARGDVCAFLSGGNTWDGRDGRWNSSVMVPKLRAQLTLALTSGNVSVGDACTSDFGGLAPAALASRTDTSHGQTFCFKIRAYCLAKADADDEEVPWDDGIEEPEPVAPSPAGCTVGGGAPSSAIGGVLAMLLLVLVRRGRSRTRLAR